MIIRSLHGRAKEISSWRFRGIVGKYSVFPRFQKCPKDTIACSKAFVRAT